MGRKRAGIAQIHWDFESSVLRNVGKDEAIALRHSVCVSYRCATRLLLVEPALVLKEFRQHASAFQCENAAGDIALMIEPRVR